MAVTSVSRTGFTDTQVTFPLAAIVLPSTFAATVKLPVSNNTVEVVQPTV
jgi:hypothetical protein